MADARRCANCGEEINARSPLCVYCGAAQVQPAEEAAPGEHAGPMEEAAGGVRTPAPRRRRWLDTQAMAGRIATNVGPRPRRQIIFIATFAVAVLVGIASLIGHRSSGDTDTLPAGGSPAAGASGASGASAGSSSRAPATGTSPAGAGSGASAGQPLYYVYRGATLMALAPAGWLAHGNAAGVTFADPGDPRSTVVVALANASGSLRSRAGSISAGSGAPPGSTSLLQLPGGRSAYRVAFQAGGVAHALYAFTSCRGSVDVEVSVRAPGSLKSLLHGPLDALAPAVQPLC